MEHSIITLEKPLPHIGLEDWHGRTTQLKNAADGYRFSSFAMRNNATNLRNETKIETEWNTYYTNLSLGDRIADLDRWRLTVERLLERVRREEELLRKEKACTEQDLEQLMKPLQVISDSLSARDCRLGVELTFDEADTELRKELSVVENNMQLLRNQCQLAWEKLNRLTEVKYQLGQELENKQEAETIDCTQLGLTRYNLDQISYKPNPTRVPKNAFTYEAWLEHTRNMKEMSENELADTYALRESLFVCREKAKNVLSGQQDRTDHAIRKRIFEIHRARNDLEWQKIKMKDEMDKSNLEIKRLDEALRDKTNALKLAETRLENRTARTGAELCIDEPYEKLCNEVFQLQRIQKTLSETLDTAKEMYTTLETQMLKIEMELNNKDHSLMTDMRGLDLRGKLRITTKCPTNEDTAQTERNIELHNLRDQIPPK